LAFSLIVFLFRVGPARGQEISLKQALELFYKNNYDILISRYEIDKAYGDYVAAKLIPNPTLSLNSIGMGFRSFPRQTDDSQLSARMDQIVELGGKRGLRTNSAFATLEASKLSYKDVLRLLLIGFYATYYDLQLDRLNVEFGRYDLERFRKIQEVAGRRFNAGFLSLLDYTKIKLSAIDVENNLTNFEKQFRGDLENFNVLLGSQMLLEPLKLIAEEAFAEYAEDALVGTALKNRYDLLALEKQSDAAGYAISLAKAGRTPDITVGAEYDSFGTDNRSRVGAGISLPIPLFYRNQGEILRRNAEYSQIQQQIEKVKRLIVSDIRQALNSYRASVTIFDSYRTRKKEVEDLLSKSETAFSLGGITVLDLLDTRKTYRDFVTKYNQALIQAMLAEELVKIYAGGVK
jgi:cobalt-zinc-cadmium efflux system outer membrane protein